ncbi:MBOAT family O-acyltransferase [Kordia sp.]|uniref:MBOAT family O-acyltransferase n=1 Tax=Kordia sp. TaxID=1965332 RepID=UPI003B597BDF
MFFNSLDFAIFFPIVFVLYWFFSKNLRQRNFFILVASYFFYGFWNWKFLSLIIISSFVDYFIGKKLFKEESPKKRKVLLYCSLLVNLGFLIYFKYFNFFIESFVDAFSLFGKELQIETLNIILPVGISFYTFQTLSYTIDIYKKKLEPTNDIIAFFSFVAFFPQLVAGPIERASHLLPQFFKKYTFNYEQVKSGILLMLWGLFKKMVIADRLAIVVNETFNNVNDYAGIEFIIGTIFFAFQIYCDFSGYSDIAIGISRTMGFDLMNNFERPYFSKSITEFWRRWHISLSTWFRDYVYIPLGGSRNGKYRTYFNLFMVFFISGIWHGAAMTFVIWGAIHGIIIVLEKATGKVRKKTFESIKLDKRSFFGKIFFITITFIIVCFAWIFFRANSLSDSLIIIDQIFSFGSSGKSITSELGMNQVEFYASLFFILFMLSFEWSHKKWNLSTLLQRQNTFVRWSFYAVSAIVIIILGVYGSFNESEFIYFQF